MLSFAAVSQRMSETKFLKCGCEHCGGHIEYPAEAAGSTTECPHCKWQTTLTVEAPSVGAREPRRTWVVWAILGFVILGLAGAAAPLLLQRMLARTRRPAAAVVPRTPPRPARVAAATNAVINDFEVSEVKIERAQGGSLRYAFGTLRNTLTRQRFGVKVELDLLDAAGAAVGSASDYAQIIEPGAEWHFRASVLKREAAAARVAAIKEQ